MKNFFKKMTLKEMMKNKSHLLLFAGLLLFGAIGLTVDFFKNNQSPETRKNSAMESPDTIIPKGYVLVPIELINAESISSLISDFAIIDLYLVAANGNGHGTRVAHHIRLLRAPLNPHAFAVLVPDSEAHNIVGHGGPLMAVVQNRNQTGMGTLEKNDKKASRVRYYMGG